MKRDFLRPCTILVTLLTSLLIFICSCGSGNDPASQQGNPADLEAPTVPADLSAVTVTPRHVRLQWRAATDNVGVTGYTVFRDDIALGSISANSFSDSNVTVGSTYSYAVSAYDAAGNTSSLCDTLTVEVTAQPPARWLSRGVGGGGALYAASISPHDPSEVYIATDMTAVFHSVDFGLNWETLPFFELMGGPGSIVAFTSDPTILFGIDLSNDSRIPVKSADSGQTWTDLTLDPTDGDTRYLYANPNTTTQLLICDGRSIYLSIDGGDSFATVYTAPSSDLHIGGVFWDAGQVFAGTSGGLLVGDVAAGTIGHASLTGIPTDEKIVSFAGAKTGDTVRFMAVTLDSGSVYPGVGGFEYREFQNIYRLDYGQSAWRVASTGLASSDSPFFVAMTIDNIDIAYVAGGATDSSNAPIIYKTTNGGETWQEVFHTENNRNIATGWAGDDGDKQWWYPEFTLGFAVSPSDPDRVIFTDLGCAHVTDDGGQTWRQAYVQAEDQNPAGSPTPKGRSYKGNGLEDTSAWWLHWADDNSIVAALTDINGLVSDDGGLSWSMGQGRGMSQNTTYHVVARPDNGTMYAATATIHDLYQSTYLTDSRIDGGSGQIITSSDKGGSWQVLHDFGLPVVWLALDTANPDTLYASVVHSSRGGIYVNPDISTDAHNWTKLAEPPRTQGHPYNIRLLNDGAMVVTYSGRRDDQGSFTQSSGVFYSDNGGASWQDRSAPNMHRWTKDVIIDPHDASQNTWYTAVFSHWGSYPNEVGGVYKTTDRGISWQRISDLYRVESMTIHPDDPDVMHVTTEARGLWQTLNLTDPDPVFERDNDYPFAHPTRVFYNPFDHRQVWITSFGGGLRVSEVDGPPTEGFSFVVFGDLNGGGCAKNERVRRLVDLMDQSKADFFIQTGDLVEGYGTASCFADHPTGSDCLPDQQSGDMRSVLLPLMNRPPSPGMTAAFFPVLGNHDVNPGWYPDPCGQGICDFLNMTDTQIRATYLTKGDTLDVAGFKNHTLNNGDICDTSTRDAYPSDFFYSFSYQNSYFIVLMQNQDYSGMLSCNGGHDCPAYCSDETLYMDDARNGYCYSIAQYDWLVSELAKANQSGYAHIFVFAHAPLLTSSWDHSATQGATQLRNLLEQQQVSIYFNGHNHAYERTHPVVGNQVDSAGTVYITVGSGGAPTEGINGDWFTAASYSDWSTYNDAEKMTSYLKITVDGETLAGEVFSLESPLVAVDSF